MSEVLHMYVIINNDDVFSTNNFGDKYQTMYKKPNKFIQKCPPYGGGGVGGGGCSPPPLCPDTLPYVSMMQ